MLVLTRKTQQQIQIGNNIVITILQVKGQSVRVGIEAPRDVRVVRGEIADKPAKGPIAAPSAAVAPAGQRGAARAMTAAQATVHFSSPQQAQPLDGESDGLFPYLRRRASYQASGIRRQASGT